MKRVIILMMDSFGVGYAPDAEKFGDVGSNTLGHIATACAQGQADNRGGDYGEQPHSGVLSLPNLSQWGLGFAGEKACGAYPDGLERPEKLMAAYGCAAELSSGKDTPSGHWEMAGVPVLFDWGYFTEPENSFPQDLLNRIVARADLSGYLGNCQASGTVIIDQLADEHIKTGKPIFYTSADSVFQIACHEEHFGLQRLYDLCQIVRDELDKIESYRIGRVIARPFIGEKKGEYERTANRHDYSVEPPSPTVLKKLADAGGEVIAIGKIADIYANVGITQHIKAAGLPMLWDKTLEAVKTAGDRSIIFPNFVDFDQTYGHRRNVAGYAAALEYFDSRLPELYALLEEGDLVVITADHGCDPSWQGTDHTREYVPVLLHGQSVAAGKDLGSSESFADIGQTIASYLDLPAMDYGKDLLAANTSDS